MEPGLKMLFSKGYTRVKELHYPWEAKSQVKKKEGN